MDNRSEVRVVPMTAASTRTNVAGIGAAAIAGLTVTAAIAGCTPEQGAATPTSAVPSQSAGQLVSTAQYSDGQYEATGSYGGGPSSIGVSMTLDNSVVTAVRVTPNATDPTSLDYQERFAEAVPAVVVGRRIDELSVQKIAGSSSTPDGFTDAVNKIKEAAQRP